ncbi:MAG: hypothetical protein LBL41_01920 [Bifidobacteriaceae bacterium]|jgi:hypothetical protein|nr:hypothetical protein [Bifidobacteriaceae bacterium]
MSNTKNSKWRAKLCTIVLSFTLTLLTLPNATLPHVEAATNDDLLVAAFFNNNDDVYTNIYTSVDGINFQYGTTVQNYTRTGNYRDPSIIYYGGYFYIICGGSSERGNMASFNIFASKDLKTWTDPDVRFNIPVPAVLGLPRGSDYNLDAVAPEWFLDTDGSLYVLFSAGNWADPGTELGDVRGLYSPVINLTVNGAVEATFADAQQFISEDMRLTDEANRDAQIYKEGDTYYLMSKFQILKLSDASEEQTLEIYTSKRMDGTWKLFNDDVFNSPPGTDGFRAFEAPCTIGFRGKKFIYADNYYSNSTGHTIDGGKTYYSVTDDFRHTTAPQQIVTDNYNSRHGTVYHVTDANAKKIAWQFRNADDTETGVRVADYAFSKAKPGELYGLTAIPRTSSPSATCNWSVNRQAGGRIITLCITPPRDDGGSPITGYNVALTKGKTKIATTLNFDAKRYSFYNLAKGTWKMSVAAVNANGAGKAITFSFTTSSKNEGKPFSDVSRSNVHVDNVGWLALNKVTNVVGKYKPSNAVNRGSMAEFMWNLAGQPELEGTVSTEKFKDLKGIASHRKVAILWAAEQGITVGSPACKKATGCTYKPSDPVNRGSMAEFLYAFAGKQKVTNTAMFFKDCSKLNASRQKAIIWAKDTGITVGSPTAGSKTYKPADKVNRGSMATFLYRISVLVR